MINRKTDIEQIKRLIRLFPVVAILGMRQCGKTTIGRETAYSHYFDLENPRDVARFDQPQLALEDLEGLIVIDEIQRKPDLFPLLRYLVDSRPKQKYLILGSASGELLRQSSETLAGRIALFNLGGLRISDIEKQNLKKLWLRGGLPKPFTAAGGEECFLWLENYITTFLERDIPQLGIRVPPGSLRRFWTMLSHYHGQILNYSELGRSFGISDMTVRNYIDILAATFMVRALQPWHVNIGKRQIKRPKLYFRDAGILHALLSVRTEEQLLAHNKLGASWEGFALECACRSIAKRPEEVYFWSTHTEAELDLFWQHGGKNWGMEFKYLDAPKKTKSMTFAIRDLGLEHLWVIYPGHAQYRLTENITALPLQNIKASWEYT